MKVFIVQVFKDMQNIIHFTYIIVVSLYVLTFAFRLLKRRRSEWWVSALALTANSIAVTLMIFASGQLPVFNLFEVSLSVILVLGGLGFFYSKPADQISDVRGWVWAKILVILVVTLFVPKNGSMQQYDHGYLFNALFHGFRAVSLSVMLFSSAYYIQLWLERKDGSDTRELSHQARNFLLLSATLFLCAEYAGILWCLNGWGDFWMWNSGFLLSTLMVLYLMLAFHIPGKSSQADSVRNVIGGAGGFVMLSLDIIRSF